MPNKITNDQLSRIMDWLGRKAASGCPFCGETSWTVDDELTSLLAYRTDAPEVRTDRGHTLVLVTCENCGFCAPFSAKKIGVAAGG